MKMFLAIVTALIACVVIVKCFHAIVSRKNAPTAVDFWGAWM